MVEEETDATTAAAEAPAPAPVSACRTPGEFLKAIKGKPVSVKLNSGVDYRGWSHTLTLSQAATRPASGSCTRIALAHRHSHDNSGILACLDGYMNIAMEQTEVS